MNSVQMITDIMFKSCLINAMATICLSRNLLIKWFVIKNNPKLLPVIFFQSLSRSRSKIIGQDGDNNDPVTDDFTFFDRN